MDILTAKADYLAAHPRGDFIAWANETVYTLNPGHPCGYGAVWEQSGPTVADAIADALQATAPRIATLFMNDRVDFGTNAAQDMADRLSTRLPVHATAIQALRDRGRTGSERIPGVTAAAVLVAEKQVEFDGSATRAEVYKLLDKYNALMAKMDQLRDSGAVCPSFTELEAML